MLMHRTALYQLTEHLYAQDADRDSNTVEVFVARLRRKLGASVIETARGLGYRMSAPAGDGG
jgi:two-component system OmpR family response regulator